MPYTLAFVDSITTTPTTRLALNNATWTTLADGSDFSPPSLRRAVVSTLLADGQIIPAAAYDNRVITLRLRCTATTEDACATAVQNLARELDRTRNFLMYQPGTSQPVFFRTLRADFRSISWDPIMKIATVSIPAEPFGIGLKQSAGTVTVNNDPAAVSNGSFFDVTGVLGDVETPLILAADANTVSGATGGTRFTSAIAVRRRGTPANTPFLRQAEALTLGTDTTLPGNDVTMSGAGSNYARCSFGTTTAMTKRLSGQLTAASDSVDLRGTYRVYAQVRHSVAGDSISLQLVWGFNTITVTNTAVTLPAETELGIIDLGLIQMPTGPDPLHDGYTGVETAVKASYIEIDAQRVSGTGNFDIDYLLFVPADDRFLLVKWPNAYVAIGTPRFVVDGVHEVVFGSDTSVPNTWNTNIPQITGGFPMVSPGVTNRIFFVRSVDNSASNDPVTGTTAIDVSYFPRYLYVRPVST